MKISNGVEMLEIKGEVRGQAKVIYPTLIHDEDNVILVDAGFPEQFDIIREEIEKAGVSFDKLKTIILTHHDIDHVGSLKKFVETLPEVKVLTHEEEKPYINGEKTPHKLAQLEKNFDSLPSNMKMFVQSFKSGFENSRVDIDKTFIDGEELPYLGGIKVIYTPGHTIGHSSLYIKESKILIVGDNLMVEDGKLVKASSSINFDNKLYEESLKKFKNFDIESVICYHGGLYRGKVNERIEQLINE
ncbi:MBL fold metallo-hydrolase [Clostridium sp. SHJSY1]|uniref:MBL fold metallo-hydrolase n=1 Tax=Clostridium sp. SHJSY1 TaxID=2942483 RepID=UPI002876A594|nr:MBL fold metallo-hydrolase [Clostridium sp. SHJSY1]MDS0526006.1 MBL fold metallo-hydrolase [Clostridium sp. SHJSY1]